MANAGPDGGRTSLLADCSSCFGLCCVAPVFSASADFAIDKAAGQPCPNLQPDSRCAIHSRLRQNGFPGRRQGSDHDQRSLPFRQGVGVTIM
jgi:hypothetical protein